MIVNIEFSNKIIKTGFKSLFFLLVFAGQLKANNLIFNQTGRFGPAKKISIYTKDDRKWQDLEVDKNNDEKVFKEIKVVGDWDIVAWSIDDEPSVNDNISELEKTAMKQIGFRGEGKLEELESKFCKKMGQLYIDKKKTKTYIAKIYLPKGTYIYNRHEKQSLLQCHMSYEYEYYYNKKTESREKVGFKAAPEYHDSKTWSGESKGHSYPKCNLNITNSRSTYLTWTWTGILNAPVGSVELTPKEIKKENVEYEMQLIEKELGLRKEVTAKQVVK